MYSKNDYRYYLEHRLLVSDDYLAHYGVIGMKWGVRHDERRASLVSKRDANIAKIATYQNKLNTVGAQKRAARAAKYQHKVDKLQRKASKAEKRLAKGKNLSKSQMKKLMKYETYKAKVAKNSAKNDKYQMKISQLQAKNAKIDKKIGKSYAKDLNKLESQIWNEMYRKHGSEKEAQKVVNGIAATQKQLYNEASTGYEVTKKGNKYRVKPRY